MKCIDCVRYQHRLDDLFKRMMVFSDDIELQSHWARYLCVLVCGFIEVSVRSIYGSYARDKAAPQVVNFVERELSGFQNPNMEKILQLAGSFSPEWRQALEKATNGELKDAIDSIVANRNNIAHGESVGITYARIHDYYGKATTVLDLIERQCSV